MRNNGNISIKNLKASGIPLIFFVTSGSPSSFVAGRMCTNVQFIHYEQKHYTKERERGFSYFIPNVNSREQLHP